MTFDLEDDEDPEEAMDSKCIFGLFLWNLSKAIIYFTRSFNMSDSKIYCL